MTTNTKFNMVRDINGFNGFGLSFTGVGFSATLAPSTDTSLTIPSSTGMGGCGFSSTSQWVAIFNYTPGAEIWVSDGTTASAPAGASFAATVSELNPAGRLVNGGDILHFYTTASSVSVNVLLYSLS